MSAIATVKIRTGLDSYITVNQSEYEDFKFMEYVEPKTVPQKQKVQDVQPIIEITVDPVSPVKRKNQNDEV